MQFGTLNPNGTVTNVRILEQSRVGKCPHFIFDPNHYTQTGCKCNDKTAKEMKGYGYKWNKNIGQWVG